MGKEQSLDLQGTWEKANVFRVPGGRVQEQRVSEKLGCEEGCIGLYEQEVCLDFIYLQWGAVGEVQRLGAGG